MSRGLGTGSGCVSAFAMGGALAGTSLACQVQKVQVQKKLAIPPIAKPLLQSSTFNHITPISKLTPPPKQWLLFTHQVLKGNLTDKFPLLPDLPPVKPSAIALGTAFNHAVSLAVLGPVFGDAYRRAQQANSKEEYFHSKEAATAAASYGSSILGSGIQAYGVGALINATGTLTYKGAAYLGSLIFFASAAPSIVSQIVTEKRPVDTIAIGAVARVLETVGLSMFLTYWGTRTNPFD
ncbi:DUF1761-domain-containing protein [Stemphylium lycopersici]|nr:DUF1761-domain-containing protein [Stemphylium lycopersici]